MLAQPRFEIAFDRAERAWLQVFAGVDAVWPRAAGGHLFMLKVKNARKADLGKSYANGTTFDVEWVPSANPDDPEAARRMTSSGRKAASKARRRSRASRVACTANGKVYLVSTDGDVAQGQVWAYDPAAETLLFESPGKHVLNSPDHLTVSPRGGLVVCEDGGGDEFLHGLTTQGEIFTFAQNNVTLRGERNVLIGDFRNAEWAEPCYSPNGRWLFANIFDPGITFAITGPWQAGRSLILRHAGHSCHSG